MENNTVSVTEKEILTLPSGVLQLVLWVRLHPQGVSITYRDLAEKWATTPPTMMLRIREAVERGYIHVEKGHGRVSSRFTPIFP